jgi:uncharacterized repeat protein (TIGR01451 family)
VTGGGGSKLAPIGETGCSPFDAYGIGWSNSANGGLGKGSACGGAPKPTSKDEVFHFLKVSVDGTQVTVTPINSLGQPFDEVTYDFGLSANLSVTNSGAPDPAPAWQPLTYTATITNDGPSRATEVTLTEELPGGTSYESATPSQGSCSQAAGTVRCTLGELDFGASATVDITVLPQNEGTIASTAYVHANEFDPDIADNSASDEVTVEPTATQVLAFTPTDDAYVRADLPGSNFGSAASFVVDSDPAKNLLLKFAVSGVGAGEVVSATLRLYCVGGAVRSGGDFHGAADNGWLESTVTWDTAPVADWITVGSLDAVAAGNWYDVDVTPLVTGDGTYSLRVTSPSPDGADYSSKEGSPGLAPQLLVTAR